MPAPNYAREQAIGVSRKPELASRPAFAYIYSGSYQLTRITFANVTENGAASAAD